MNFLKRKDLTIFVLALILISFSSCGKRPPAQPEKSAVEVEKPLKPAFAEAKALADKGENDKAVETVEKEIQKNPEDLQAFAAKAEILEHAGKKKEAYEAYGAAIEKAETMNLDHPPRYLMHQREKLFRELLKEQPDKIDENFKDGPLPPLPPANQGSAPAAVPAAPPAIEPAPVPVQGDLKITLSWNEPVDVDLKVEDESGNKQKLAQQSDKGPGSETFLLKADEQNGGKYYAAANLIGMMGSKAAVKMTVNIPGKPPVELSADLAYDGTHQFWIAFSINTSTWEMKTLNAFDSSIQNYKKKEPS